MTQKRNWLVTLAQLGLSAAWLMSGAVYVLTPPRMAAVLAMPSATREVLGIAMFVSALVAGVGAITRSKGTSIIGVILLVVAGTSFTTYDALRHWTMFTAYDGALAIVAIVLLVIHVRNR
ncbi:MAG TPA: hypothetical protein VID19_08640 [Candidatus Eremiobacteraceae bacterium]|jgi:hypothetical protein